MILILQKIKEEKYKKGPAYAPIPFCLIINMLF